MNYLQTLWDVLKNIQFTDLLDILIVAFLLYKLLPLFRSTGTSRIAGVVVIVLLATWLTGIMELHTLNFVMTQVLSIGLIAIVVLFQPELRRMIDHMTKMKFKNWFGVTQGEKRMQPVIEQTVKACESMSREKVGALIVFARDNRLEEYFKTGTRLDAEVSEQLIRNVFFVKAPLHDGAMIVRDGRIAAAACVLPLSDSDRLNADLGTRHRAAVGMSEASDAVVVVVSEETGVISVAVGGMLKRHLAPKMLEKLLLNEICPEETEQPDNLAVKLRQKLQKKGKGERKDGE